MVGIAFLKNDDPENKRFVNHKDKKKQNNNVENLEWITRDDNNIHANGIKVKMINPKTGNILEIFRCISEANKYLGISKKDMRIHKICKGELSKYNIPWIQMEIRCRLIKIITNAYFN